MNIAKRIVLATHGTLGDVHPYLAIALELRARGHKPVIATSEYHRRKIEAEGLEFHALTPDISFADKELHRRLTEPKRGLERVVREFMLPVLRKTYDDLLAVVEKDGGADLLVSQILIFAAPLVAEKTGVKWVSTELQPGAFMSAYDPPVLAPMPALANLRVLGTTFHRALFWLAKLKARSWSEPVRRLRLELGLSSGNDPLFAGRNSPRLVLALFSPEFAQAQPDWPANTQVTGFSFYDERDENLDPDLTTLLNEREPPLVFTLGSSAVWDAGRFYIESVAAAQRLGRPAVLFVGNNQGNQLPKPLPAKIVVASYGPYAQIFPRASMIVHHGGIGTTAQALRAGKPMLIMPFGGDQYDNGARVRRLGVGRTIMRKHYTAERVIAELEKLGGGTYAEKALSVGRHVQLEDGVRRACNALEEVLG